MSDWLESPAHAKVNLALVVGPLREDDKHEVVTVLERLSLADTIAVRRGRATHVEGFADDTLVGAALEALGSTAGTRFEARIEKRIPVASGLGGGSSDAATALRLANALLDAPLDDGRLHAIAAGLGSDVPFFLRDGAQVGTGDGTTLETVVLPRDYTVLLVLPPSGTKRATADVYRAFDERGGADGFPARAAELRDALASIDSLADLARLPPNDLTTSSLAATLLERGAVRADVSGAGPVVYGLFADPEHARATGRRLPIRASWVVAPAERDCR